VKGKTVKHVAVIILMLPLIAMALGCSGKLSRHEATHQIDAMMKPHPVGSKKVMSPGGVPGFQIEDHGAVPSSFSLVEHKEYGNLTFQGEPKAPSPEDYILNALSGLGYVSVQEEGPKKALVAGSALSYSHSRTVRLTQKVGTATKTGYSVDYDSGFSCYPEPNPTQCSLPTLIDMGKDYQITGIVQDDTHAKVNILISWKLTRIGLELKPYALAVETNEDKLGIERDYYTYAALYAWEHFLNAHSASGSSPATILFQKFDDGWRIVDEGGKSERDFN
jgi:hypothetical protein